MNNTDNRKPIDKVPLIIMGLIVLLVIAIAIYGSQS